MHIQCNVYSTPPVSVPSSALRQLQLTPKYSHPLTGPVDLPNMLWLALPFDAGSPGWPSYANNDQISATRS